MLAGIERRAESAVRQYAQTLDGWHLARLRGGGDGAVPALIERLPPAAGDDAGAAWRDYGEVASCGFGRRSRVGVRPALTFRAWRGGFGPAARGSLGSRPAASCSRSPVLVRARTDADCAPALAASKDPCRRTARARGRCPTLEAAARRPDPGPSALSAVRKRGGSATAADQAAR